MKLTWMINDEWECAISLLKENIASIEKNNDALTKKYETLASKKPEADAARDLREEYGVEAYKRHGFIDWLLKSNYMSFYSLFEHHLNEIEVCFLSKDKKDRKNKKKDEVFIDLCRKYNENFKSDDLKESLGNFRLIRNCITHGHGVHEKHKKAIDNSGNSIYLNPITNKITILDEENLLQFGKKIRPALIELVEELEKVLKEKHPRTYV